VTVDTNGSLFVQEGAGDLGVSLRVGGLDNSFGEMKLYNMNKNLRLTRGAGIWVSLNGVLDFAETTDSATTGGITQPGPQFGLITNAGIVRRSALDGAGQTLQVNVAIANIDNGALEVTPSGKLAVNNPAGDGQAFSIALLGNSVLRMKHSSSLSTSKGIEVHNDAAFRVYGDPFGINNTTALLGGDLRVFGGEFYVGYDSLKFVTLQCTGNITMTSGTFKVKIDSVPWEHDSVQMVNELGVVGGVGSGTFTINQGGANNATMQIIANAPPAAGVSYDVIQGSVQGSAFVAHTWFGFPPPLGYSGSITAGVGYTIYVN
jgi:hypothetical protein